MTVKNSYFISLEGIEGVGKSTQMQFLKQTLDQAHIPYIHTREPGCTVMAEELRTVLLKPRTEIVQPVTAALLLFAARVQHIHNTIQPAIREGKWVLCDRFVEASYAYQGGGRGLNPAILAFLEQETLKDCQPDFVLLLDAPVEIALQRVSQRGNSDRFEKEGAAFFERVRQAYLARAEKDAQRYRIVDASGSLEAVAEQIKQFLASILP